MYLVIFYLEMLIIQHQHIQLFIRKNSCSLKKMFGLLQEIEEHLLKMCNAFFFFLLLKKISKKISLFSNITNQNILKYLWTMMD